MLSFITEIPEGIKIGSVHCVPVLDNGDVVMVWDRDEKVLTTIGGRLEPGESIMEGLIREALEEAGIQISDERTLFAAWHWKEFDAYRLFYLVGVRRFVERPEGYETTGYVRMNFDTAIEMIKAIEGREERIEVIRRAGILSGRLAEEAE
ncbi:MULTISPECIES: NUDIX hydrolase [Paenibacillus]|uniref:NUDIX hydrolase n=1 Tax=Paenibacillus TaxID=44249 RepID=UPI00188BAA9B|nr:MULTISPECIES: NUDIX hydrolase [Paenibacillus]MBX4147315.1 NUDIX hydrolase [Paenibacillus lautus]